MKRGTAPPVGAYVTFRARLNPPLAPLRPGGYDFARDLYFQRIGASGFVTGTIKIETPPMPPGLWLRYATFVDGVRESIDRRIRAAVPGDAGSIASALITGKRDAISTPVNDAMYVSSLAHVLSISGYHMAVVAGVVFFTIRALLALLAGVATRYPIKKWGAAGALVAAALYLALSGAEVATQRAFIMTAIVLVGVMADRAALTLRTLAVAAMGCCCWRRKPSCIRVFRCRLRRPWRWWPPTNVGCRGSTPVAIARSAPASRCGAGIRSSH